MAGLYDLTEEEEHLLRNFIDKDTPKNPSSALTLIPIVGLLNGRLSRFMGTVDSPVKRNAIILIDRLAAPETRFLIRNDDELSQRSIFDLIGIITGYLHDVEESRRMAAVYHESRAGVAAGAGRGNDPRAANLLRQQHEERERQRAAAAAAAPPGAAAASPAPRAVAPGAGASRPPRTGAQRFLPSSSFPAGASRRGENVMRGGKHKSKRHTKRKSSRHTKRRRSRK